MQLTPTILEEAVVGVAAQLPPRLRVAIDWRTIDERRLWRELIASILGSAVSFEQGIRALTLLDSAGLTNPPNRLINYQADLEACLRRARYRFPACRSQHIANTAKRIYGVNTSLRTVLLQFSDPITARRRLVTLCVGLGPKQASLFLRNIGYNDFAVLDRHVLAYLRRMRFIEESVTAASSFATYEKLE